MADYFDPEVVMEKGKPINHAPLSSYPTGKFFNRLVAVADRGLWKVAADVTDRSEYHELHDQYRNGLFLDFRLYDFEEV